MGEPVVRPVDPHAPARPAPERRERLVDAALAVGAALLAGTGGLVPEQGTAYDLATGPLPALAGVVAGAALWWRRRHAPAVFLTVTALATLTTALHWHSQLPVVLLLAGYALGAFASPRAGVTALVPALLAVAGLFAIRAPYFDSALGLSNVGMVLAAWLVGLGVAHRSRLAALARQRRRRLPQETAEQAERTVVAERLRLARLLYTQVSAALAEVAESAGRARSGSTPGEPGELRATLAGIESASRQAADDLRQLLGTLRAPEPIPARTADRASADWPVDAAIAIAVVVFNVGGTLIPDPSSAASHADPYLPALLGLSVLPGLALLMRRRFPVAVLAVALAVVVTVYALRWPEGTIPAALVVASYAVGAWAPGRRAVAALAGLYAVMALLTWLGPAQLSAEPGLVLVVGVPWLVGLVVRQRRLRDHAELAALRAAEQEQAARLRRAVLDERLAVARDLHDVVSHNLSGIVIQAAAARRRAGAGEAAQLLRTLEQAARTALTDLQQMVHTLRSPAPRQPSPGLAELEALVARHRRQHGPVALTVDAGVGAEPASSQLAVFRVVQEALANAAKHATGAPVQVRIGHAAGRLSVRVDNDAGTPAEPGLGTGVGLTGLAERVALLGGTVQAGPTEPGGFRVHALLPSRLAGSG